MEKAAHDCGIHIRFKNFTSGEKILSFAVTDSPESKECDRIIGGIKEGRAVYLHDMLRDGARRFVKSDNNDSAQLIFIE